MTREEFIKKYESKTYLGDGLYVHHDGYHFILSTERENGEHWVALEPEVFDTLIFYRLSLFKELNAIEQAETGK